MSWLEFAQYAFSIFGLLCFSSLIIWSLFNIPRPDHLSEATKQKLVSIELIVAQHEKRIEIYEEIIKQQGALAAAIRGREEFIMKNLNDALNRIDRLDAAMEKRIDYGSRLSSRLAKLEDAE